MWPPCAFCVPNKGRTRTRTRPSQSGPGCLDRGCFGRAREKLGCAATCHPRPAQLGGHSKILEPPSCFTCAPAGACEQGRRGAGRRPEQANTGDAIDGAAHFASGARAQARTAAATVGRTADKQRVAGGSLSMWRGGLTVRSKSCRTPWARGPSVSRPHPLGSRCGKIDRKRKNLVLGQEAHTPRLLWEWGANTAAKSRQTG